MKIAILPGDGIGPEIVGQAQRVLDLLRDEGLPITTETAPMGGAGYDAAGRSAAAGHARAGAGVRRDPDGRRRRAAVRHAAARSAPRAGLACASARRCALFANLRPALLYPELAAASSLKPEVVAGLDLLIVRELTGDIYFGQPRGRRTNAARRGGGLRHDALQRAGDRAHRARRLRDRAQARASGCARSTRPTCSTRASCGARPSRALAPQYPDVALSHMYVDNAAMQLVRNPKQFDVIVTGNMFGDILSDEASMLAGSIGMLPSASLDANAEGPVRADPRLGARHRGPGQGQSAGDDPVARDDVPLHVRARRRRRPHRARGAPRAAAGPAYRRHRAAGRADRSARARWATR